eukprot:CAMPEP_0194542046 /NCGR_PEP_ID=MMETSP0253-20130528/83326_1 /TAXON_ID=2966 /ORGANISM="Noctiluca scintillans" /LENGTH=250 /DNA_ID=CAMNT_0039388617 /DNA_START=181 /DNA_END=933 /DNA_ORIENTATION=-
MALAALVIFCFVKAILTNPGHVPDSVKLVAEDVRGSSDGTLTLDDGGRRGSVQTFEVKQAGGRRFCRKCVKHKPDRCHHCRVCGTCVLQMDHHCPWIANCVGFRNHKYFFLVSFYAALFSLVLAGTTARSTHRAVVEETTQLKRFLLVFCTTISLVFGVVLSSFFSGHLWLVLSARTTIEHCELKLLSHDLEHLGRKSLYDQGWFQNLCTALGSQPVLWFCPLVLPEGDGMTFKVRVPASTNLHFPPHPS